MATAAEIPSEYTRIVGRSMAPLWLLLLGSSEVDANLERLHARLDRVDAELRQAVSE